MSNSFNIDVKPEISAVADDIAAVKTVVDDCLFNIIDNKIEIASIKSAVSTILTDLTFLGTTYVLPIKAKTDIIGASVALETLGNISSIKAKTDNLPQNVRGSLASAYITTDELEFQDVVNVSGQGILYTIAAVLENDADAFEIKLTIDGHTFLSPSHTGDTLDQVALVNPYTLFESNLLRLLPLDNADQNLINFQFNTSLLVQIHRSAGTAAFVHCKVLYSLDDF